MFKLVIIDDEYYTLEGMKRILDWEQYQISIVGTASNGMDGLSLIREKGADIVIVDIRMNGMDGLSMIKALRDEQYPGKIIILSGYQRFDYAKSAIDLKVDKYLTKPINPAELEEVIVGLVSELQGVQESDISEGVPELLKHVLEEIDAHYTENIQLSGLAEQFYCSTAYLSKLFKKYIGMNYLDYIKKCRIEKAKEMLKKTDMSVDEIVEAVGWQSSRRFREAFRQLVGISPSEFRRNLR